MLSTSLRLLASDGSAPRALREAAVADPRGTIGEALATPTEPAVTTALLALEAGVAVVEEHVEAVRPLTELVTLAGSVQAKDGVELSAVVIDEAVPVGEEVERGVDASAYREGVGCGVAAQTTTVRGVIEGVTIAMWGASAHPIRARQVEGTLQGRRVSAALLEVAVATLRSEVQPRGQGRVVDEAALREVERVGAEALRHVFGSANPGTRHQST